MLEPGDRVGRYEIQAVVGEGGFGQVYRAWDPELERLVAIKELSGERKAHEPTQHAEYVERFRLERRAQGRFQHSHIVSVYDLVQQGGDEYLVVEFVAGGTLRGLIEQEGHLSPERVIQIGVEMCQAIATAWEQDIVHRDVKPSNVLLTEDGHAKLTDFGVAQVGHKSQRTQSDSHHPGTPAYMSPEQELGRGYLDERSDLYSLGLALYKSLTGKSFKRERVPVRQLAPGVPKGLDKVVMRALAHDPADRYQRAAEFEFALRHALDRSRPGWLWWVGGVVILLALIAGGRLALYSFYSSWGQSQPTPIVTATLSQTPASPAPTSTPTKTPAVSAPSTSTPGVTLTLTTTLPLPSTPMPAVSAPRLISPPGAAEVKSSRVTFRWVGELPDSSYGFRVSLRHGSDGAEHTSPILEGAQWIVDLPGDARDAIGEWFWSVAVVRRSGTQDAVARSDEWTLYYDPFGGHSPFSSPLPTPAP